MDSNRDDTRTARQALPKRVEAILEETESLGSVIDRLVDERYESPIEAREAILNELTGEEHGLEEYNDQRALDGLAADTDPVGFVEKAHGER